MCTAATSQEQPRQQRLCRHLPKHLAGAHSLAPLCTPPPPPAQRCVRPARDIFTSSSTMVASLVVLPLIPGCGAPPLGGLYYASPTPVDFANMQDTLLVGRRLQLGANSAVAIRDRCQFQIRMPSCESTLGSCPPVARARPCVQPNPINALPLAVPRASSAW